MTLRYSLPLSILLCASQMPMFGDDLQSISGPKNVEAPAELETPSSESQKIHDDDTAILIPRLKGLVLVGDSANVTNASIEALVVQGLTLPGPEEELFKRLAPFFDKPVTQRTINQIKRQIILFYREAKYPLVMVFVPEQKIHQGVLHLVVIESRADKIEISGGHYTNRDRIRRMVRLESGNRINEARLLQDVSWINMNPYRSANIVYSPGEKNGTTNINVRIFDRRPWRIYAGGDNTGSKFTGEARWFVGFNFENALFPDNIFSYQFTTSSDFHKFISHTVQYVAPFPWRNTLSIFGGLGYVKPHIPSFHTQGKSYQASGRYDIPLWFTYPSHPQQLTIGFDFKGTNNNVIFGEDNLEVIQRSLVNLTQFVFGYHYSFERRIQKMGLGVDVFWSPAEMVPHQTVSDYHTLNAKARPKYVYTRFLFDHQWVMPGHWTLNSKLRLQLSDSNLLASEQFGLGGYNTVRGYRERVVNGDNAVCANLELHTPSFPLFSRFKKFPGDALFFLAFIDFGHAWDHSKVPGLPRSQTLIGIGPGFRYRISSYLMSRFDIGIPLHSISNAKEKTQIHVSVVGSY